MSFMFNPVAFNDPHPVNRPEIPQSTVESIVSGGTANVAAKFAEILSARVTDSSIVVAFDGYTGANWSYFLTGLGKELSARNIQFEALDASVIFKSGQEIDDIIDPLLIWDTDIDPTLLYGKIYRGRYEGLMENTRIEKFRQDIASSREKGKVIAVYGYGSLVKALRKSYDIKCFFDLTPKNCMLRIQAGEYSNIGKTETGITNRTIRRCYYCDFENAVALRHELLLGEELDYYFLDNDHDNLQMIPFADFAVICSLMVKYPFRANPCYLEGVWGGTYMKKLRGLPENTRNIAWVYDFIPMEISLLVEAGKEYLDINYCTFVHHEGINLMGSDCVEKFHGYFPIRLNYDDSYHSTGNMSVQCHSGGQYNIKNYNEFGRQDEAYYVVATGHDAKTFIGFRDDADIPQFFRDIENADRNHVTVDYMKYVSFEKSFPGLQVMIPAGTIHASGRNQLVLEAGSLTFGSYTYKMYDYLRLDFDGKQRPIHTRLGEANVRQDRRSSVIHDPGNPQYIVQSPRLDAEGDGWKEYIIGENPQVYFSLRRLEFEKQCHQDTKGEKFHLLTLVDGEKVRVRSLRDEKRYYDMNFLDIVCVPSSMGEYVIENLGNEPIRIHKTCLRDGYQTDPV